MIIPSNIKSENIYFEIFKAVKTAFIKLGINAKANGRPRKYSDEQIMCCMIYGVKNSVFSLRELEYRIRQDFIFRQIVGLTDVPDYSTFSLRAKNLESHIFYGIYAMVIELIDPDTRICAIDGTALRSSKYDSEAKSGKGTRLGFFKGYKLHCIAAVTDIIIPLVFDVTTANVYDNQVSDLIYELKTYNPFLLIADAAYDSVEWFDIADILDIKLLIDINMRKAKSIDALNIKRYKNAVFRESIIGKQLYKNRLKIEQLFSVLKGLYNLENPRLYGQARYERHIKWVLLAYLIDEYNKKQSGITSRKYPWNL